MRALAAVVRVEGARGPCPVTDSSIAHVWCMAVHPCACQCNCARACVHCAQLHVFVEQRTRPVAYEAIRRGWVSAQPREVVRMGESVW